MEEGNKNYLAVVLNQALLNGRLTQEDIWNIQTKLWHLLGQHTERYTMGDSSSVPVEIAEELLKSIFFSIGICLKGRIEGIESLMGAEDISVLLKAGWAEIESRIETGRQLLQKAKDGALPIDNYSYHDTLSEIGGFFKKYDYRFFAHEMPCSIDYQLCHAVSEELLGIEYINEYLRRLIMENEFCRLFDTETVVLLLKGYCTDYREQLINLYEPIAINAIGLTLLDRDILALDITDHDREWLLNCFKKWTEIEAVEELKKAAEKLCCFLHIQDVSGQEYLKSTTIELYARVKAALTRDCLDKVFFTLFRGQDNDTSGIQFVDGGMMDNKDLSKLIDEITSCRFVSDKIAMVKREVHSLRDLLEVLNICFWGDDCTVLFDTMENTELALLLSFLRQKDMQSSHWHSESGWEDQLLDYIHHLEGVRKIEIEKLKKLYMC